MTDFNNLGRYETAETVKFLFQFIDATGQAVDPVTDPVYRIFKEDASVVWDEVTDGFGAISMTSAGLPGLFKAELDISDWDGGGTPLTAGRHLIHVYTPDLGISSVAMYIFDYVDSNSATLASMLEYLYGVFNDDGVSSIITTIENSVWNADPSVHASAGTFGARTLTESNISDVLDALSVTGGFTAGNDLDTLKTKIEVCEAVATGRWKIDAIAKTWTYYELDGVTPLVVFNLTDSEGTPATRNIAERTPV